MEFLQRITTEVKDKGNVNTIRPLNLWENKPRKHYVDFVGGDINIIPVLDNRELFYDYIHARTCNLKNAGQLQKQGNLILKNSSDLTVLRWENLHN